MGCGCGGGSGASIQSQETDKQVAKALTSPEDCTFSKETLDSYIVMLNLVRTHDLFKATGISFQGLNAYIGLIQSALNYPDNYCLFETQLNTFSSSILPKLTEHVSEYIL